MDSIDMPRVERRAMSRSVFLFVLALSLKLGSVSGEEAEQAPPLFSQPPQLVQILHDDFERDSRDEYRSEGRLDWTTRELTLSDQATLNRQIAAGPHVHVELDLLFSEPVDGQSCQVRFLLDLDGPLDWLVILDSTRKDGTCSGRIRLLKRASRQGAVADTLIREYPLPGGPPNGRWQFDHRYGLLMIETPNNGGAGSAALDTNGLPESDPRSAEQSNDAFRCAYTHVKNAGTVGIGLAARGGPLVLKELTISSIKPDGQLTNRQQQALAEARQLDVQAQQFWSSGKYAEALDAANRSLEIRGRVMGRYFRSYSNALNSVAVFHQYLGDQARAEPLYEQLIELMEAIVGVHHPDYAIGLGNLAEVYHVMGKYQRAEELHRRALRIFEQAVGTETPPYDNMLHNLAVLYLDRGDLARAEPLCKQAMRLRERRGKRHPSYAISMETLGMIYHDMGDIATAAKLYEGSLEILAETVGKQHPDYAITLYNLARSREEMGQDAPAEALLKEALEIIERAYTTRSRRYADGLQGLASHYHSLHRYADAEPLYRRAQTIVEEVLGPDTQEYADCLETQSWLALGKGELDRAESLAQQALEIRARLLGKHHRHYVNSLSNLASVYYHKRDFARSEPFAAEALMTSLAHLDEAVLIQSQRQQHLHQFNLLKQLHFYLSLAVSSNQFAESAWEHHLNWKGAVFVRQHEYQQVARDAALDRLWHLLQETTGRISAHALREPATPQANSTAEQREVYQRKHKEWFAELQTLAAQKESLEKDLYRQSDAFRRARQFVTAEQILATLPAATVLVDFAEYWAFEDPIQQRKSEPRYVAFIARPGSRVTLIDLGPVKEIAESIKTWRQPFYSGHDASTGDQAAMDAANFLRQKLWEPLEPHLDSADTVLLSTAGALGELPFAALPGKRRGTFLLEDHRLANVLVPRLLPTMLGKSRPSDTAQSLLLVGDIDYDTSLAAEHTSVELEHEPLTLAVARDAVGKWSALPHALREIALIENAFRSHFDSSDVTRLDARQATEESLRRLAPRHRNLHIVTHGFFADQRYKSVDAVAREEKRRADWMPFDRLAGDPRIRAWQPGLLSGLVLSGANRASSTDDQDGILTAEEVEYLSLTDVDLVVLSACETDLSVVKEGERIAGLQRAFQVAGAASTVASLWKVDDKATSELMVRFYHNLWGQDMSKLDALREAQLWMLDHTPESRGAGRRGTIGRLKLDDQTPSNLSSERTSPYYWGAFVLAGDWR
jgi:CHAT domain-containing protein